MKRLVKKSASGSTSDVLRAVQQLTSNNAYIKYVVEYAEDTFEEYRDSLFELEEANGEDAINYIYEEAMREDFAGRVMEHFIDDLVEMAGCEDEKPFYEAPQGILDQISEYIVESLCCGEVEEAVEKRCEELFEALNDR